MAQSKDKRRVRPLLHGGDYNPEQWLDRPEILEKDIEYLQLTGCNTVTLGVFAWGALEPREGVFRFDWLEKIMDRLHAAGIGVILATPSGARPRWLAQAYPEVLRTDARRVRQLFGERHNHCYTSPVYREKTARIDRALAQRFSDHPAVIMWHISNELGGECHCPLCQEAFRNWLRGRYASIDELNQKWWTAFWSHQYDSFDQIESPSPIGESHLHALDLEWKRFVTAQTISFLQNEVEAVRSCSDLPVTTNFMYYFDGLDYFAVAGALDVISWDSYPTWHKDPLIETARDNGFWHDMMRSLKRRPFLLMESCPSATNWQDVSRLKRPGELAMQSLQAIAHGADGAMYFQIRQSRGASEKFHGAVIDHYGGQTRVMREVKMTGEALARLDCLAGTKTRSRAAILYDWSSIWAMHLSQGPRNVGLHFKEWVLDLYHACKDNALDVDLVDESVTEDVLAGFDLLIVPMGYQFRAGFAEKLRAFTRAGGALVVTFHSGIADETDLCYQGAVPHDLTDVLGIRRTETDGLYDWEKNSLAAPSSDQPDEAAGDVSLLRREAPYTCRYLCDLVESAGARTVLVYAEDFYKGTPALTVHPYGEGEAWYVAGYAERRLCRDLIAQIMERRKIPRLVKGQLPAGLTVTSREGETDRYLFFQNFGDEPAAIPAHEEVYEDLLGDSQRPLPPLATVVVRVV